LLGVAQEIMELISMNFEMPWKISNIPQNITGISVQKLEILKNGNNLTVTELHSLPATSSSLWMFSCVWAPWDM
jgi:hypothetical protein